MKLPVIGVTPHYNPSSGSYSMNSRYMRALSDNGAIPVLLPVTADPERIRALVDRLDGFLFTGGDDVSPALYGEERTRWVKHLNEPRDQMERLLAKQANAANKPVLAICRGMQMVNVALGGSLYQDLKKQKRTKFNHRMHKPFGRAAHTVEILPGTPLSALLGRSTLSVNSLHHQAVKELAPALRLAARAEDGVTEAWFDPEKRFFMGVQWHPEFLYRKDAQAAVLFRALAEAAAR